MVITDASLQGLGRVLFILSSLSSWAANQAFEYPVKCDGCTSRSLAEWLSRQDRLSGETRRLASLSLVDVKVLIKPSGIKKSDFALPPSRFPRKGALNGARRPQPSLRKPGSDCVNTAAGTFAGLPVCEVTCKQVSLCETSLRAGLHQARPGDAKEDLGGRFANSNRVPSIPIKQDSEWPRETPTPSSTFLHSLGTTKSAIGSYDSSASRDGEWHGGQNRPPRNLPLHGHDLLSSFTDKGQLLDLTPSSYGTKRKLATMNNQYMRTWSR